jgi:rhomboid protease GluP
MAVNLMLFVVVALSGNQWFKISPQLLISFGGNYSPYTTEGEWWRMVAAIFLHGGIIHIAFNLYALYSFGRIAERLYGAWTFSAIYLLSGIAGSTGTLLRKPVVGVGASGAIFGIIGALLAFLFIDRIFLKVPVRRQLQKNFAIFSCYALFYGLGKTGIDIAAHLGGFLCGLVLGFSIGEPVHVCNAKVKNGIARVGVGCTCTAMIILLAISFTPRPGFDYEVIFRLNQIVNKAAKFERESETNDKYKAIKELESIGSDLSHISTQSKKATAKKEMISHYIELRIDSIKLRDLAAMTKNRDWASESTTKYSESQKLLAELSNSI